MTTMMDLRDVEADVMADHMRKTSRTVSVAEAERLGRIHDADDFTPAERLPFDTGSMRRFN